MTFRLRDADATLRLFLTGFIIVLTLGYAVGLLFVEHSTSLRPGGVAGQFRGSPPGDPEREIRYEKSINEMLVFLHNHIMGLSLMLFALGSIFYCCSIVSNPWKRFLLLEPMLAVLTTFGGIVLVRFVSPLFSWLVLISGISLFLSIAAMAILILTELWFIGSGTVATPAPKEYLESYPDDGA